MYQYRVWILRDEFTEFADTLYQAKKQAVAKYMKKHPKSYVWAALFSLAHGRRLSMWEI